MPSQGPRGLTPLRRERLYESLVAHISDFIEAQGLGGGDRLPPERQMAADFGVSRATVSRALAALESQGRIEIKHGVGALVRESGAEAGVPGNPGSDGGLLDAASRPADQVVTARESMLAGLARAAAGNPNDSLRVAMLADDGRPRSFGPTWQCVRRLAQSDLLADLDDMLAANAPDPADTPGVRAALDVLADAIVRGDASAAALACPGMLTA